MMDRGLVKWFIGKGLEYGTDLVGTINLQFDRPRGRMVHARLVEHDRLLRTLPELR